MMRVLKTLANLLTKTAESIETLRVTVLTGQLTNAQWGNRLHDFCLDDLDVLLYWRMVDAGLSGQHAFQLVTRDR